MRRLAVDRTSFQGQIVNCHCCLSQYLAENTVFLSDNVSNSEAVRLYLILCRKSFFLFDFYESLLVKKSQVWNLTKIHPVGIVHPWDWGGRRKVGISKRGSPTRIAVWIFQATERSQRQSLRVSRAAAQARVDWVHVWVCRSLSYKIEFGYRCKHRSMNTVAWSPVVACKFRMPTVSRLVFGNCRLGVLSHSLEGLWHIARRTAFKKVIVPVRHDSFPFKFFLFSSFFYNSPSSLWVGPLTFQVAYVIIFCSFHFRLNVFLP